MLKMVVASANAVVKIGVVVCEALVLEELAAQFERKDGEKVRSM